MLLLHISLPSHCTQSLCSQSFTVSFEGLVTLTYPVPVMFWQPIGSRLPLKCSGEDCPAPVCSADPSLRHLHSPLGCQCIAAITPGWTATQLYTVLLRVFSVRHCAVKFGQCQHSSTSVGPNRTSFLAAFQRVPSTGGLRLGSAERSLPVPSTGAGKSCKAPAM